MNANTVKNGAHFTTGSSSGCAHQGVLKNFFISSTRFHRFIEVVNSQLWKKQKGRSLITESSAVLYTLRRTGCLSFTHLETPLGTALPASKVEVSFPLAELDRVSIVSLPYFTSTTFNHMSSLCKRRSYNVQGFHIC